MLKYIATKPKGCKILHHGIWWTLEEYLEQIRYTMKCFGK